MSIRHFRDWHDPNSLHEHNKKQMDRPVSVSTSYFIFHVAHCALLNVLQMRALFDTVYLLRPAPPPAFAPVFLFLFRSCFLFLLWETPLLSAGWWLVGWATSGTFFVFFPASRTFFTFGGPPLCQKKRRRRRSRRRVKQAGERSGFLKSTLSTLPFAFNIKQAAKQNDF